MFFFNNISFDTINFTALLHEIIVKDCFFFLAEKSKF